MSYLAVKGKERSNLIQYCVCGFPKGKKGNIWVYKKHGKNKEAQAQLAVYSTSFHPGSAFGPPKEIQGLCDSGHS